MRILSAGPRSSAFRKNCWGFLTKLRCTDWCFRLGCRCILIWCPLWIFVSFFTVPQRQFLGQHPSSAFSFISSQIRSYLDKRMWKDTKVYMSDRDVFFFLLRITCEDVTWFMMFVCAVITQLLATQWLLCLNFICLSHKSFPKDLTEPNRNIDPHFHLHPVGYS